MRIIKINKKDAVLVSQDLLFQIENSFFNGWHKNNGALWFFENDKCWVNTIDRSRVIATKSEIRLYEFMMNAIPIK